MLKILNLARWRDAWKEFLIWIYLRSTESLKQIPELFRVALTSPHPNSPLYTLWVDSPWEPTCARLRNAALWGPEFAQVSLLNPFKYSGEFLKNMVTYQEQLQAVHSTTKMSLFSARSSILYLLCQAVISCKVLWTKDWDYTHPISIQWWEFEEGMFRTFRTESKDDHRGGGESQAAHPKVEQRKAILRRRGGGGGIEGEGGGWMAEVGCQHCCGRPLGLGREWVLILEASRKRNVHTHG